jgi:hypothetical protein
VATQRLGGTEEPGGPDESRPDGLPECASSMAVSESLVVRTCVARINAGEDHDSAPSDRGRHHALRLRAPLDALTDAIELVGAKRGVASGAR